MLRAGLLALTHIAVALLAGVWTYLDIDPVRHATAAQQAIIGGMVDAYCHGDKSRADFFLGNTAAASRIAVAAGVNDLAKIETEKCIVYPMVAPVEDAFIGLRDWARSEAASARARRLGLPSP